MPDISHASPKEQSQPLKDAEGQSGPRQSRHPDSQTGAGSARKRSTSHSGVTTSFARKSRPYSSQADIQSDLGDSDADSTWRVVHITDKSMSDYLMPTQVVQAPVTLLAQVACITQMRISNMYS